MAQATTTSVAEYNDILAMRKKSKRRAQRCKDLPLYLMMLPGLLYLVANNYLPMFGILIAFKKINFIDGILRVRGLVLTTSNFCSRPRTHLL